MTDEVAEPTVVESMPAALVPDPVVEPIPAPAPVVLTDDELATQQAASGAPGTGEPVSGNNLIFTNAEKTKIRANIRWLMAELDWARSGRLADERETLNP